MLFILFRIHLYEKFSAIYLMYVLITNFFIYYWDINSDYFHIPKIYINYMLCLYDVICYLHIFFVFYFFI